MYYAGIRWLWDVLRQYQVAVGCIRAVSGGSGMYLAVSGGCGMY